MPDKINPRHFGDFSDVRKRALGDLASFKTREAGDDLYIEGYFAVFNSEYEIWPGAAEIIRPGAFSKSISGDVRALINHDSRLVLGRTTVSTLELREDSRGLWGSIKINRDDSDAMNLYTRVQRGDVDQCSFGFDIEKETIIDLGDGGVRWEIEVVNPLYEVSVCTFPAYEETSVVARKKDLATIQARNAEAWRLRMKNKLGGSLKNGT